jgi:hypothetical protein
MLSPRPTTKNPLQQSVSSSTAFRTTRELAARASGSAPNIPDRKRYFSMHFRKRAADYSDIAEIALIKPGDILFLYTDGVYDGSDEEQRHDLEELMRDHYLLSAKDICNAVLERTVRMDDHLRDTGEQDRIDDKTVFIIKRSETISTEFVARESA